MQNKKDNDLENNSLLTLKLHIYKQRD